MKICIVGGRLQGIEACYLARACGMESILIDIDPEVPARGLADHFAAGDLVMEEENVIEAFRSADIILPANENDLLLEKIAELSERFDKPLAFDPEAYEVTKSKILSDRLFRENGIPCPKYFPEGKAPYVAKPSDGSGSTGVIKLETFEDAETYLKDAPCGTIVQEYLEGPSYSIEVIGHPGNYRTYTVTEVHVDKVYDCFMITSPVDLPDDKLRRFSDIAVRLAELVGLKGIMDVEVIDDGEDLKVLEIDARLPSQTPIAVLKSSGMNLLKELTDVTVYGEFRDENTAGYGREKIFCAYENYRREDGMIVREGEHIMRNAGPLTLRENFLGSMESMTDCTDDNSDFRGIFINWGDEPHEVMKWKNTLLRSSKG
ncbi:MAG: 3-methylornithine--L-lysine ligase PylC [Firmicutes bacterium]|nr:3-methylornithine--L-lysine ligase PylC [Bacillota bacterium]